MATPIGHVGVDQAPPRAVRRGNLRARLTSFVGRDDDVGRIGALLAAGRLVTLLGPGGAGKTRLAVESAEAIAARVPDGVWLVELAPVGGPQMGLRGGRDGPRTAGAGPRGARHHERGRRGRPGAGRAEPGGHTLSAVSAPLRRVEAHTGRQPLRYR
ncbi:hypothetical protein [Microbispora sp. GKU 823]|uniref:hypothetical protein n=1 Tax=Microbispora sp. GKU 823 TaxID=1652100 RepID=UPI001C4DFE4C|nr:hypothetical protein [Microbispora sp. GKU 823]